MTIAGKLPTMEENALAILHTNAERLMETGTSAQQSAAAALMPLIKAELVARRAAKLTKAKAPTAKRATKTKPVAADAH